jgi:hypothetical protein
VTKRIRSLLAFLLALNFFLFHLEVFEEEYEREHPKNLGVPSLVQPPQTNEAGDKENAQAAFIIESFPALLELTWEFPAPLFLLRPSFAPFQLVRDKSPPVTST